MNLNKIVYGILLQVPRGRVTTYGAIASALGDIRASRAIGQIMNQNPRPVVVPCHRVVHSNGEIGGYSRGVDEKIKLLEREGIAIKNNKIQNFENAIFKKFKTKPILKELREEQKKLARKVKLKDSFEKIETIAGIDVSYSNSEAVGACVVFDYGNKKIIEKIKVKTKVNFPYIPTYLSYREFPVIQKLIKKLKNRPTVLMLDGNGILHPLRIGIASHAGVLLDLPTIGVAKKLLLGEVRDSKIFYNKKLAGYALGLNSKPIYISPGSNISFETTLKLVKEFCRFRIPEPLRQAHILSQISH